VTRSVQHTVLALGVAVALAVAVHLAGGGWQPPALWLTGAMLGVALYRGAFGFTAAYRATGARGIDGQPVRGHLLVATG
jgi:CBS-domain-containing membrane protein